MSDGSADGATRIALLMDTALRYQRRGELTRAEEIYREILREAPEHADALQFLGLIYRDRQPGLAVDMVRRAAELNPDSADVHYNLGLMLHQDGDTAGAVEAYRRALAIRPTMFEAMANLALVHSARGELAEARDACEGALRLRPGEPAALNNLGTILEALGEFDGAIRAYERALGARPDYVEAMVNLAQLLERQQRVEDARTVCDRALACNPASVAARALAARLDLRDDRIDEGLARLQDVDLDALPAEAAAAAWFARGQLCERLGRYEDAWQSFARGNRRMRETPRAIELHRQGESRRRLARLDQWFDPQSAAAWPAAPPPDGLPRPIFLVGFPRSGTTLLDQMLTSHPALYTLEEHDLLSEVIAPFQRSDAGLARLDRLPESEWRDLRARYWELLARTCLGRTNKRFIVDKYPLNIAVVPIIQRLFPEARLIVAERDPRDVCVSCFAQHFELNSAMVNFLTLPETVSYYVATMSLWLRCEAALSLELAKVRYETLVRDPRRALGPVLDSLDVGWDEGVLDYAATARARTLRTPSYTRVVRPLDESAVGRWRHYRPALEPFMPQLAPLVRALGYADN